MKLLPQAMGAASVLLAIGAAAQDRGPDAQTTKLSLGTATPGGGFPLYGGAVAEVVNETDRSLRLEPKTFLCSKPAVSMSGSCRGSRPMRR